LIDAKYGHIDIHISIMSTYLKTYKNRAVFLDRDGVINIDHGYVHCPGDFEFIDGIFDLMRAACAKGYKLVIITNQAGIGRGYYSEQQFHQLTDWMCNHLSKFDISIEKVYFSPFHPTEGLGRYKKDDISRKPRPGMIFQAQQDLDLDLKNSILIGDKPSDIQAGISAGVGLNIIFSKGYCSEFADLPYVRIEALQDAIPFLECARTGFGDD